MILRYLFPNGKPKALTMSYDDGVKQDRRLTAIFNRCGIKGTFHLNSGTFGQGNRLSVEELPEVYAGHEIAVHSATHPFLDRVEPMSQLREILDDRRALEALVKHPVTGMSHPMGTYNRRLVDLLRSCGITYSRTVRSTGKFVMPDDFLEWNPTCHHRENLSALGKAFREAPAYRNYALFYVWSHAYEFDYRRPGDDWEEIERFCSEMSGLDDVWYATNGEICAYDRAIRSLIVSVDSTIVCNPSSLTVWLERDGRAVAVPGGATVQL